MLVTDGNHWRQKERIQTAILTHNYFFFSWSHHHVFSSSSGRTSFPSLRDVLKQACQGAKRSPAVTILYFPTKLTANRCKTFISRLLSHSVGLCPRETPNQLNIFYPRAKTNHISRGHLHIPFHNAHYFPSTTWLVLLIYTSASYAEKILLTALSRVNM